MIVSYGSWKLEEDPTHCRRGLVPSGSDRAVDDLGTIEDSMLGELIGEDEDDSEVCLYSSSSSSLLVSCA